MEKEDTVLVLHVHVSAIVRVCAKTWHGSNCDTRNEHNSTTAHTCYFSWTYDDAVWRHIVNIQMCPSVKWDFSGKLNKFRGQCQCQCRIRSYTKVFRGRRKPLWKDGFSTHLWTVHDWWSQVFMCNLYKFKDNHIWATLVKCVAEPLLILYVHTINKHPMGCEAQLAWNACSRPLSLAGDFDP